METNLDSVRLSGPINPGYRPSPRGPVLGRIGSLDVRLAANRKEVDAAQALRYQVFVEEMGATLPADAMRARRDFDAVDSYCDHLLVLDTARDGDPEDQIVGTYRLLTQSSAECHSGFYSQSEFDVGALVARNPDKRFLELGRSCVLPEYRTRRTIELLWQGNWAYCLANGIDVMFGCASFPGDRPYAHALALSFIHQVAAADADWSVRAVAGRGLDMDMMPSEAIQARAALAMMPPLVKGYLRVGAMTSTEAVVDPAFRTTDILVILPVKRIAERYVNHYGADAGRFAA
ncbi:ornithine-acyl[acyl carrier protein] N-acyltransferase [Hoeflea marina]|uniref:L-ornithine N(alpha)-acyltransferase n=1 Tax=Hoeflea marina TaxID=274592 RepID=A0A317PJW8_9HYPH|nr:GNAT family N-acetyltransferase [Hoeflea marina]PWW00088.1 ornithine-acyl[acyl carrier protein] N-acyltransferase [Hoeflea marina]